MKIFTGIGGSPGMAMGRAITCEKKTQVVARIVAEENGIEISRAIHWK